MRESPKRIIHLISSLSRGGRERQLATIYKFSDIGRMRTRVVCFRRSKNSYIREYGMEEDVIYLESTNQVARIFELRKLIRDEKADIIWSWGGIEATIAMASTAFSNTTHINGSIRHGITLLKLDQLWRMLILQLSGNIVANSKAGLLANQIRKGKILYNGIDSQFLQQEANPRDIIRQELGIQGGLPLLISVANLLPYKDYPTVLRALSEIRKNGGRFHYLIIGEGSERQNIEAILAELELVNEVTLAGRRIDVKDLLSAGDLFIHSSLGEGCSNAILEAMAAGLPVIASDTGGTSEIVDATTGRLFKYQDIKDLTNQITELLGDETLRISMQMNAREMISTRFSINRMMEGYYTILEEVIGK